VNDSTNPIEEEPHDQDPRQLSATHFFTYRTCWNDRERPDAGIGIAGIYIHVEPPEGYSFPICLNRMFIYFQLWGDIGEYFPRIRLVKIDLSENNEEVEVQLGMDGAPKEFLPPTPRPFAISGLDYCVAFTFPIGPVHFRETGTFEFQLWVEGYDEPLARERILAREFNNVE
jgi:hypothetical protein